MGFNSAFKELKRQCILASCNLAFACAHTCLFNFI